MTAPVKGKITSAFGYRIHPISGERKHHNGIDISVPVGTGVVAPEFGEIITARFSDSAGYMVTMKTDTGREYIFMHLQKYTVKVGEKVEEGQLIAKSGNTGASTGPHLHFEIKENGKYIDPAKQFNF